MWLEIGYMVVLIKNRSKMLSGRFVLDDDVGASSPELESAFLGIVAGIWGVDRR